MCACVYGGGWGGGGRGRARRGVVAHVLLEGKMCIRNATGTSRFYLGAINLGVEIVLRRSFHCNYLQIWE